MLHFKIFFRPGGVLYVRPGYGAYPTICYKMINGKCQVVNGGAGFSSFKK
jgi:hypothetical protein